jgi:ribonuclease HII
MKQTIADIRKRLDEADEEQFAVLERALAADTRKGIKQALERTRKRLDAEAAERDRIQRLYRFQNEVALSAARSIQGTDVPEADEWITAVGLDEVGRGPLAGPLTVGAVVLPASPQIQGLSDSKQLSPARREELSEEIRNTALAWDIEHIPPAEIDDLGMSACLRRAFSRAVAAIDEKIAALDGNAVGPVRAVLLDGNPLHIDSREVNLVKGDARVAAISAASIIAKVERDALMDEYARMYPAYGFDSNKGYGSAAHIAAIEREGLCPLHRKSFCQNFSQGTLF